jgi:tRNA-2-methylthio-N6-dimethylallyladenosine synthase
MKCYLETFGCQMNMSDSEVVRGHLESHGFVMVDAPEDADVLLLNTCSIREHAEVRALGRLTDLYRHKRYGRGRILGVLGCVAQHHAKRIPEMLPGVDLVLGPDNYRDLPAALHRLAGGRRGVFRRARLDRRETYDGIRPRRRRGASAWVQVMRGCDRFCAYCIVPYVRGRERSRDVRSVLSEVEAAVLDGIPEVVLLGQNVNAYAWRGVGFPELLRRTARVPGIRRVRFMTSHPVNFTPETIAAMRDSGPVCNALHLPLQSGSDRILRAMNREYTVEEYIRKIDRLRAELPDVSLSTDLMVGFPGESESDFRMTLDVVRRIEFDSAYMFRYSPRRGTKAASYPGQVPDRVASNRLAELIAVQKEITARRFRCMVGSEVQVLVEGSARRGEGMLLARTEGDKTVVFPGRGEAVGTFLQIRIIDSTGATLIGERTDAVRRKAAGAHA